MPSPLSRLFWYAVFETLGVIAMAMYVHYLSIFPPLMPVQVPGVRSPDVLHKDSATVQGIEVFCGTCT